jgi:hypothetical protein
MLADESAVQLLVEVSHAESHHPSLPRLAAPGLYLRRGRSPHARRNYQTSQGRMPGVRQDAPAPPSEPPDAATAERLAALASEHGIEFVAPPLEEEAASNA